MTTKRPAVYIWTDGSTTPKNPGPAGWAAVLRLKRGEEFVKEEIIKGSTEWASNIRMETLAAVRSLQYLKVPSNVVLHTDSQYIIDGFKRLNRHQILKSHHDLWGLLLFYKQVHNIYPKKVKGHSGVEGNELADNHAKQAALMQEGDPYITAPEKMIEDLRRQRKLDDTEL